MNIMWGKQTTSLLLSNVYTLTPLWRCK